MNTKELNTEELKEILKNYRKEHSDDPQIQCYVSLFVREHPTVMVQDLDALHYEIGLALGKCIWVCNTTEVQKWLDDRSIVADLSTCGGWLLTAEAMWHEWAFTDNPGRHNVGRIVSAIVDAGIPFSFKRIQKVKNS